MSVIEFEQVLGGTAQRMKFSIKDFFNKSDQISTHFSEFGLNTVRYYVSLRVQSEYGKIRADMITLTEKTRNEKLHFSVQSERFPVRVFSVQPPANPEMHSEPYQTSMMDLFGKIVFKSR